MFSVHDSEAVLAELGPAFVGTVADCVDLARQDWESFQGEQPKLVPGFFNRDSADIIHVFLRQHLKVGFETSVDTIVREADPNFELVKQVPPCRTYVCRVKRHSIGDRVVSYPTRSAIDFFGGMPVFPGMDEIHLAVGYRWDPDLKAIRDAVISYHEGMENPIWAVTLERAAGTGVVTPTPIEPILPDYDLVAATRVRSERRAG
jgi:hypothetical protein